MIRILAIATLIVLALAILEPMLAPDDPDNPSSGTAAVSTPASQLSDLAQSGRTFVIGVVLAVLTMVILSIGGSSKVQEE